jgi:hypothetical protein
MHTMVSVGQHMMEWEGLATPVWVDPVILVSVVEEAVQVFAGKY